MTKGYLYCNNCGIEFISKQRNSKAKFCSVSCYRHYQKENLNKGCFKKGNTLSEEQKRKISLGCKGRKAFFKDKKLPIETRLKMSESHKLRVIEGKNHLYRGGLTEKNKSIRNSSEYRLWRESVFIRDKYTCVWCNKVGGKLNADHIKPFALYPEIRFAIDNGRTLCEDCHKTTDTYGNKTKSL